MSVDTTGVAHEARNPYADELTELRERRRRLKRIKAGVEPGDKEQARHELWEIAQRVSSLVVHEEEWKKGRGCVR